MPLENREPRRDPPLAATLAIFALAFLLPAWPWLSGAVTIPWDAKSQFWPQLQFMANAFAKGQSPFWTPNVFAGWPQIADPQSLVFSPLHVLLAWLDPNPGFRAADAVTFAHLFIGGLGVILIFRDRGWHAAGALVAALAFAFGGACASRLQHTGQVESVSWLPLAVFFLTRALDRRSWKDGAAAGAVAGLLAIGRDQVALLSLYVLVGFVLAHWLSGAGRPARLRASLAPLAAGAVAGALIASMPVVLTLLLAGESNRPEIDYTGAGHGSLHPVHLLTFWFADLYGAADPEIEYWAPPGYAWNQAFGMAGLYLAQNMGQVYAGALVALMLVAGLVRRLAFAAEIRVFAVLAALVLLYALGWYTPAFRAMYEFLPGVALFRRPADATFVLVTLLAVIAGYCVHRFVSGTAPAPTRRQRTAEIATGGALIAFAVGLAAVVVTPDLALVPVATAAVFAAGAILALRLARRVSALAAAALLAAFTAGDLAWNNAPNISTGLPPALYEVLRPDTRNETVRLIKSRLAESSGRPRVELIGIAYHWPNLSLVHDLDHVFGQNPLRLRDFVDATGAGDTVATPEQRGFSSLYPSYRSAFADLLGVRLVATGVPVEKIDVVLAAGDLTRLARTPDAHVYENPRALPRAMLLTDWRVADFASLVETGWPDIDPRRTVLLERPPGRLPPTGGGGAATLTRYANTEVAVAVDAPAGGVLLLNDVWHPWWRARLDGVPVEILKANVMFRAVAVPPGRHTVRFTFHPFAGALAGLAAKLGRR